MISLRKHIDAHLVEAAAAIESYREILLAVLKATSRAIPHLEDGFGQKMSALNEQLAAHPKSDSMREIHMEAGREITGWGIAASRYLRDKAQEVREMMLAVANVAAAAAERDQRYTGRFNEMTAHLQSIARLEDLTSVRRSLVESAAELRSCTQKMASEGAAVISRLTSEVSRYRLKLEESERRETVDVLTSLFNRRAIENRIDERIQAGGAFSLALLDLNGFKSINDQYGHVAGDDLLRQFAAELQNQFKPGGIVGRWGGDEFVAIVPGGPQELRKAMASVRSWTFGAYRLNLPGKSLQVKMTAAVGLAEWNRGESLVELIARADERMYAEKRALRGHGSGD